MAYKYINDFLLNYKITIVTLKMYYLLINRHFGLKYVLYMLLLVSCYTKLSILTNSFYDLFVGLISSSLKTLLLCTCLKV